YISDEKLYEILSGEAFITLNIENFVVDDFFHWTKSERSFKALTQVFRKIAQEISTFDFSKIDEDILKGVYQGLIDLDTRHSLGEYYTPDWLCERVVQEYDFKKNSRILDPSCGSGSFLRAAIARLKTLNLEINTDEIAKAVHGIDIHPLSVQIAKTTVLLSLGKDVSKSNKPVKINIILANTLLAPDGAEELFGNSFKMNIDKQILILNSKILDDIHIFDEVIDVCEELAEHTKGIKKFSIEVFENNVRKVHKNGGLTPPIIDSFYKIYESFKIVKEEKRDTIWKFIVQNLYKPYFLANKFDFIVGNPPWFTFSSVKNEEYQNILDGLAERHKVMPKKSANYPHLEIAAIFLAYCSGYFLRENGKISMVLPRSFFSGDQHDNTRSGLAKGFKITNLWDLEKVSPLFNIPSCVIFGNKDLTEKKKIMPFTGLSFKGKIPKHNCHWEVAEPKLVLTPQTWFYAKQGNSSAFSTNNSKKNNKVNPYKTDFKQGATLVPRTFYFVDIALEDITPFENDKEWNNRTIPLKTAEHIKPDAKKPWNLVNFKSIVHSEFLFRTALSKNILPFCLLNPDLILLPIIVENKDGIKKITIHSSDDLYELGWSNMAKWTKNCENIWNIHATEKSKKMTSNDRVNYQRGITSQNLNAPYLVIYTASSKDANATIVKRSDMALEFIVESAAYVFFTANLKEAYFLTGYLNASKPNLMMKDYQSKGLFGPRHVSKKILDVYFPTFNENEKLHISLAHWSEVAHAKAKEYVEKNPPSENIISAIALGKLRTNIKKHIAPEMLEIDKLVEKLMEN
ncbi:MAG: restriction endonuclease, partial [Cytophagales bacterium]